MAGPAVRVRNRFPCHFFLSNPADILLKSQYVTRENPRIFQILRIAAAIQINSNMVKSSPEVQKVRELINELSLTERLVLGRRFLTKSLPYGSHSKPILMSMLFESLSEDGSLWCGDPNLGVLPVTRAAMVSNLIQGSAQRQATPKAFAEPFLQAALVVAHSIKPIQVGMLRVVVSFGNLSHSFNHDYVDKMRFLENALLPGTLMQLSIRDRYSMLSLLSRTTRVHPNPAERVLVWLYMGIPEVISTCVQHSTLADLTIFVRNLCDFRISHRPMIDALVREACHPTRVIDLPFRAAVMMVLAGLRYRSLRMEENVLQYVRSRRFHHLMLNPVLLIELGWAISFLRGERRLPDELQPYVMSTALRYMRDNLIAMDALPCLELIADDLSLPDEVSGEDQDANSDKGTPREQLNQLLYETSLEHHRASRQISSRLATDAGVDGDVLVDVRLGPLFAHAAALVHPDTGEILPWPQNLLPEDVSVESAERLPGVPVALLIIPELERRRMRPGMLMGLSEDKCQQLERRGWKVAVVSHGALSLRNDWFPSESLEVCAIDDMDVLCSALSKGCKGRPRVDENVSAVDDIVQGLASLATFETYNKDFLTVLFDQELASMEKASSTDAMTHSKSKVTAL